VVQAKVGRVKQLRQDHFLPKAFEFMFHQPPPTDAVRPSPKNSPCRKINHKAIPHNGHSIRQRHWTTKSKYTR